MGSFLSTTDNTEVIPEPVYKEWTVVDCQTLSIYNNRCLENLTQCFSSPTGRYVALMKPEQFQIYLIDMFTTEVHNYGMCGFCLLPQHIYAFFVNDWIMCFRQFESQSQSFIEHFVEINHVTRMIRPLTTTYRRIGELEVSKEQCSGTIQINRKEYTLLWSQDGDVFLIPCERQSEVAGAVDARLITDDFEFLGKYLIKGGLFHTFGSEIFFLLFEKKENQNDDLRLALGKVAVMNLSDYNLAEGNIVINNNDHQKLKLTNLTITNFVEESAPISMVCDWKNEYFALEDTDNCYVANFRNRTISKLYESIKSENLLYVPYGDSMLQTKVVKETLNLNDDHATYSLKYKLIYYKVPKLKYICQNYIIKNGLQKNLNGREKKVLFPKFFK